MVQHKFAFTMAEILLSLTIIGVVAAITLPSLTGNINERTWNTQRKALYARLSQALSLMPSLNGYGVLTENTDEDGSTSIEDTAAETFLTDGLSKVLKINNICDSEHLEDCGLPSKIIPYQAESTSVSNINISDISTLYGLNSLFTSAQRPSQIASDYSQIDTKAAAFETANGESILTYYNPYCIADMNETGYHWLQPKMCANFVYDLNGNKGPNTVGKDIGFITVMYSSDPVVAAPVLAGNSIWGTQSEGNKKCTQQDPESRMPNRDEVSSMFFNQRLIGIDTHYWYWSSSIVPGSADKGWLIYFDKGYIAPYTRTETHHYQCIKR